MNLYYCRYSTEAVMHKNIRTQTNQIFHKIRLSLSGSSNTNIKAKQVDRRSDSRYYTVAK